MDDSFILIIRITVGLTMVTFGLSQLKSPREWLGYIPEFIEKRIPDRVSIGFMRLHAAINVGLGLLYMIGQWESVVAWLAFAWWLSILPFAYYYNWKIGMRDLAIVAMAFIVAMALMA